jgi:hypothetical protein
MKNPLTITNYWLENIVIGLDLCPFARIPWEKGLIRTVLCEGSKEETHLEFFLSELEFLHENPASVVSTTIIVYPDADADFLVFNDFVGDLESMLSESQLNETFQLVAFHPRFMFLDSSFNDVENLVNRSPYPVLHILRSADLDRARLMESSGSDISFRNEAKLKALSQDARDALFYYLKESK